MRRAVRAAFAARAVARGAAPPAAAAVRGFGSASGSAPWWQAPRMRRVLRRLPLCLAPVPFAVSHRLLSSTPVVIAPVPPPSPSSTSGTPAAHSHEEAPRAVVVLLGWLGCEDKHLKKYADLYERLGREVIVYSPSSLTVFAPEQGQEKVQQLLDRIQRHIGENGERPVLWHAMSNNGAYHYAFASTFLADRARYPTLEKETCGVVYDSAPSQLTIDVMTRGFTSFIAGRWGSVTYDHWALSPMVRSMFSGVLSVPHYDRQVQSLGVSLSASSPVWASQMFLYSDADELIPSTDIRAFADAQWARRCASALYAHPRDTTTLLSHRTKDDKEILITRKGGVPLPATVGVTTAAEVEDVTGAGGPGVQQWRMNFPGSAHVEHGRRFPREYQDACLQFALHAERQWQATKAARAVLQ